MFCSDLLLAKHRKYSWAMWNITVRDCEPEQQSWATYSPIASKAFCSNQQPGRTNSLSQRARASEAKLKTNPKTGPISNWIWMETPTLDSISISVSRSVSHRSRQLRTDRSFNAQKNFQASDSSVRPPAWLQWPPSADQRSNPTRSMLMGRIRLIDLQAILDLNEVHSKLDVTLSSADKTVFTNKSF